MLRLLLGLGSVGSRFIHRLAFKRSPHAHTQSVKRVNRVTEHYGLSVLSAYEVSLLLSDLPVCEPFVVPFKQKQVTEERSECSARETGLGLVSFSVLTCKIGNDHAIVILCPITTTAPKELKNPKKQKRYTRAQPGERVHSRWHDRRGRCARVRCRNKNIANPTTAALVEVFQFPCTPPIRLSGTLIISPP